jgi:PadR family transcriptional regulator PadR
MSKRNYLGEMELMVLLAVVRLGDEAYGVPISKELLILAGREVALGSIYAALDRLEQKGFVTSSLGDPTPERGGRAKRYFRVTPTNEARTGDLIERFREGQTRGWFWWQVLIAFAHGILSEIRRHWPHFCYAIAGVTMPAFLGKIVHGARLWFHWSSVPWPWSQLLPRRAPPPCLPWRHCLSWRLGW